MMSLEVRRQSARFMWAHLPVAARPGHAPHFFSAYIVHCWIFVVMDSRALDCLYRLAVGIGPIADISCGVDCLTCQSSFKPRSLASDKNTTHIGSFVGLCMGLAHIFIFKVLRRNSCYCPLIVLSVTAPGNSNDRPDVGRWPNGPNCHDNVVLIHSCDGLTRSLPNKLNV
ncbi:hypothetical protein BJV77DRAFT_560406 [Russula vinacea]|nr:hypothetical protein BJV77DRAFT_560406 [Russula vinacea]